MDCLPHIHVAAIHAEPGYRTAVPGIGAFCRDGDVRYGAGGFRNSIGNRSAYASVGWQPLQIGYARVGAFVGAATGYPRSPVVPLAAALVSFGNVHFIAVPRIEGKTPATLSISFTWEYQ